MRRLTSLYRQLNDEDGGVAITFGVLLLAVFVGFAALVADSGALFQERRELQNAADAGAYAIAFTCARQEAECNETDGMATAAQLANANASDNAATVTDVSINAERDRVTVQTQSLDPGGDPTFVQQLVGLFGFDNTTVVASATAVVEPVGASRGIPLTFSTCEWDQYFPVHSGETPPFDDLGAVITFHNPGANECNGPAGQDMPGGFGWLVSTICEANVVNGWNPNRTGNPNPGVVGCTGADIRALVEGGEPVLFPLFEEERGSGNNGEYLIRGFAAMYLTGFRFPGNPGQNSYPPGNAPCGSPDSCISGYFTEIVPINNATPGGPDDFGAVMPRLIE